MELQEISGMPHTVRAYAWKVEGGVFEDSLDTEEGLEVAAAMIGQNSLLHIEEKFNMIMENYAEFEQSLFNASIRQRLFASDEWVDDVSTIFEINRRLLNLCGSCRLYIDHSCHDIAVALGRNSEVLAAHRKQQRRVHSESPSYRFMEELRNYSQHRGMPANSIQYPKHSFFYGDRPYHEYRCGLFVSRSRLRNDKKFKQSVLSGFGEEDRVDLKPIVRDYVSRLNEVHSALRLQMNPYRARWIETLASIKQRVESATEQKVDDVEVIERNDAGEPLRSGFIFDGPGNKIDSLVRKNRCVMYLRNQYDSTCILGEFFDAYLKDAKPI